MAWSKPTIEITPGELKSSAEQASANINKHQNVDDILKKLDDEKLIDPGFEKIVDSRKETKDASLYAFQGPPWVSPEPGAGLIRDMPELIAPFALVVNPNRGAVLMFARKDGALEYEDPTADQPKFKRKKRKQRAGGGMMAMGGMGGRGGRGGGGMGMQKTARKKTKSKAALAAEELKAKQEEDRRRAAEVGANPDELVAAETKDEAKGEKPKEITKGVRCVAIIGKLDHKKLKSNYVRALKDPAAAPHYLRLDLQRQDLNDDDEWTEWVDVKREFNQEIINNSLEKEAELTPADVRLDGLVDHLPFFKAGYWRSVHVKDLVSKENLIAKAAPAKKKGSTSGASGTSIMDAMQGMMGQMGMGGEEGGRGRRGGGGMGGMNIGMGTGMPGMMAGGGRTAPQGKGGPADVDFAKSNADTVMVRALDFTVDPDATYRYRVRLVVRNPNYGWETVSPGTDTTNEEKEGPWSEPTGAVAVPDDVTTYAYKAFPLDKEGDKITFYVAKWNEDDGMTITKTFEAEPGQFIGEKGGSLVPAESGKGTTSKYVDFTSRQLLIDAIGSVRNLELPGVPARFEPPALAVVMRSDGALLLRDQAKDNRANSEMRQMKSLYDQIIADAKDNKKKESGGVMGGGGLRRGGGSALGAQ
jgi:hypothetical protein